jgi:hypothetical protein
VFFAAWQLWSGGAFSVDVFDDSALAGDSKARKSMGSKAILHTNTIDLIVLNPMRALSGGSQSGPSAGARS